MDWRARAFWDWRRRKPGNFVNSCWTLAEDSSEWLLFAGRMGL